MTHHRLRQGAESRTSVLDPPNALVPTALGTSRAYRCCRIDSAGVMKKLLRSLDQFPKQGAEELWKLRMNYLRDVVALRRGAVADDAMRFRAGSRSAIRNTAG